MADNCPQFARVGPRNGALLNNRDLQFLLFGVVLYCCANVAVAQTVDLGPGAGLQQQSNLPNVDARLTSPKGPTAIDIVVPDLLIAGATPVDIDIHIPDLVIVAADPVNIAINVPDLVIVAADPVNIAINVPDLVIVGAPEPVELDIDIRVPELIIASAEKSSEDVTDVRGSSPPAERPATLQSPDAPEELEDTALAAVQCSGNYMMHAGQGQAVASGLSMPVGQTMILPARVENLGCGASLIVTAQGQSISLDASDIPGEFSGSVDLGDGPLRTMILVCGEDLNLRGGLIAQDSNLRITRPMWLIRDSDQSVLTCDAL
jgi:hypothetical protein